ncbi:MAG: GerMN domain-containing protein [Actinomycetota bacterium]
MRRILAVMLVAATLGACGTTDAQTPTTSDAPSPATGPMSTPTVVPEPVPDEATTTVELWYSITATHMGEALFVVHRDIPSTPGIGAAALRLWLEGPSAEEKAVGVHGAVPEGVELLGLDIDDGTAIVDLSAEFENTNMGTSGESLLLEQLAWTLTQFPTVDRVRVKIDGEFKDHYMGHGFIIDEEHPLERNERDPLSPIVVSVPHFGAHFASGDAVAGTANVFEANVSIRLLDEGGDILFDGFTTATCGTGCRGDYSKSIRFDVDHEQRGAIELFEVSAEDGSETNKVTVPVVLVP